MDRRGVIVTLCTTVAGGGIAAVIGATALPSGSPYFSVLIDFGVLAILVGAGGLVIMLFTAPGTSDATSVQGASRSDHPPPELDGKGRAIWALSRARETAIQARKKWFGFEAHHRAFSEMRAAILGVKKEFGVAGLLKVAAGSDEPSYRDLLRVYIAYVDSFLPLLQSGQIETAQKVASNFSWSQGWD